jgi:eukaryotic-like serine/threonine-protein kinase
MDQRDPNSVKSKSIVTQSISVSTSRPLHPPADPILAPGDLLAGRFKIVRFIARGGMGEVYEAGDQHLRDTPVALKTLRPEIGNDPLARQRFEREVLVAREVHHLNVCPTYDIFREEGDHGSFLFLTMKLLSGESLGAMLARLGPLTPNAALPLLRQMAAGLDAAHSAGVVHRDFKPGNVIVDSTQQPPHAVITDFGISLLTSSAATLSGTGHIAGTPGYIAPEIFQGNPPTSSSDVYAFGVVLRDIVAEPPKSWTQVIRRCLDVDPALRPKSAGEAVALLTPEPQKRLPQRRALLFGTAAAVVSGAAWYEWPAIDSALHPLPDKRFVALMAWPPGDDPQNRGLLHSILDAIESRLVPAEAASHNLLIISAADPRNPVAPNKLADVPGSLGANLVLAASLATKPSGYQLGLQVLDSTTSRVLRSGAIRTAASALNRLLERGCALAAKLLDVPIVHAATSDEDELARLPAPALESFTQAEDLITRPNDSGLDAAIEKYQKTLEMQPRFAAGYAQLARAYLRKYQLTNDSAVLTVARRNAELARQYNPSSNKARFSAALVAVYGGSTAEGIELLNALLRSDPTNPQYAHYKARALRDLGRRSDEQAVYREIIRERPNYWPSYNELGWSLYRDGHADTAAKAFAEASAVAPRVALPLANLGSMYLALNRKPDAADAFRRSLDRAPNYVAYLNLGSLDFEKRDYRKALVNYQKARDLKPRDDLVWRNIADCETVLGNRKAAREAYEKAAAICTDIVQVNPKLGRVWMSLAFYLAKLGRYPAADEALRNAERNGATDVASQFLKAQTLAATGRNEASLSLVLQLLERGLSPLEVEWALDLDRVRADVRYKKAVQRKTG